MRRKNIYFPNECFYCGRIIRSKWDHSYDHVVPLSKGGEDSWGNLVDCCKPCNQSKANLSLKEWKAALEKKVEQLGKNGPNHPGVVQYRDLLEKITFILTPDDKDEHTLF